MKFGAEPKKMAVLGGLLAVAGIVYWNNRLDSGGPPQQQQAAPAKAASPTPSNLDIMKGPAPDLAKPTAPTRSRSQRESAQEFRPTLKAKRPEDRPDPTTVDPTLQLALLARLKTIKLDGGSVRSLFDFAAPPVPKAKDPGKIIPGKKGTEVAKGVPAIPTEPAKPTDPPKPTAPPIPLKFYGFIANPRLGTKRAFFLEGEEIHVASEGETVKKRYKVVRIGINSVVMEDTEFKSQQTLPLEEQPQSS
jgi:hypothetical protein